MPKRPREHELEELSRRAFADALPPGWVHRSLNPDYGLDETVETFDAEGVATGLSFHAQLKATDELNLSVALKSIRFRRELTDYYRSLALPVLVVLFHAPTERLFARWFHAYNPHVAIRGEPPPVTKTVGFQLSEPDEWTSSTPNDLEAGVRGFVAFRSPELPLPLSFSLSMAADGGGESLHRHLFALRAVLKPVADLVTIEAAAPAAGRPSISLSASTTVVSLADVATVTLEHDASARDDAAAFASNVAVAIATVLARVGQSNLAAEIGAATAAASRTILDYDVAFTLAGAMSRARRVMEALRLADALDARGQSANAAEDDEEDARIVAFVIQTVAQARASRLNAEERRMAVEVCERILGRAEARGDVSAAGAASYNLAMLHRGGHEPKPAIAAFRRTTELDPSYASRAYFHSDFAGVLFESGAFGEAAEHYECALALGASGLDQALFADALLFSGRYADAEKQLDEYVPTDTGPEGAEWRLKQRLLRRIRVRAGDSQARAAEDALALAERVDFTGARGDMSIAQAQELIARALDLDALCAEAWFRQSLFELGKREDPRDGFDSALTSAVLHRYVTGPWINAVMLARAAGESDELMADLLRTAYRFNGDAFVSEIVRSVHDHEGSDDVGLLSQLDAVVIEVDRELLQEGFVMRVPDGEGTMVEFSFEPTE